MIYTVHPKRTATWTLVLVAVTTFMLVLDLTVVTVALGAIQVHLHAGLTELQWVVDAYAVALAVLLLAAATLGDRIGRRRVFLFGVGVFTLASLACGLASSPAALDIARAVQGIGGAALLGTGPPLLADAFPKDADRNRALGFYAAVSGSAVAAGPLVGGALTGAFGWRAVFLVNVPVGIVAVVAGALRLRETRDPHAPRIDWAGTALLSGGLLALVVVLLRGQDLGWTSAAALGLFALGVALLGAFLAVQRRISFPTVDLTMFRRADYSANAVVGFLVQAGTVGSLVYLSLYLQSTLGLSALDTGLRFLSFSLVALAAPVLLLTVGKRIPARAIVIASAVLVAAGLALMATIGPGDAWSVLLPGLLVAGAGIGLNNTVVNQVALTAAPPERAGMASGTVNALKQIGLAAGVAILGTIHHATAHDEMLRSARGSLGSHEAAALADAVGSGGGVGAVRRAMDAGPDTLAHTAHATVRGTLEHGAQLASAHAIRSVLLVAAAMVAAAAVIAAIGLLRSSRRVRAPETPGRATAGHARRRSAQRAT
jgi:EmrB/QacA subfamily drug resistance transporter